MSDLSLKTLQITDVRNHNYDFAIFRKSDFVDLLKLTDLHFRIDAMARR